MSARPVRDRGASREPGTGPQAARDLPERPPGRRHGGRELVRRSAGANRGNSYGAVLAELGGEIESDRRQLEALMRGLDIGVDRLKVAGGWLGEKLGRLKPNGRLLGYSPLSRLVELEVLSLAVQGKLSLWRSLRAVADEDPTLAAVDFDRLIERAQRQ